MKKALSQMFERETKREKILEIRALQRIWILKLEIDKKKKI